MFPENAAGEIVTRMQVYRIIEKFIQEQKVSCAESIYQLDEIQLDEIQLGLPELLIELCGVVGYYEGELNE